MNRVLILDDCEADAARCRTLVEKAGYETAVCLTSRQVRDALGTGTDDVWAAVIVLWETAGPPFAADLLATWRLTRPGLPVLVAMNQLDVSLAARLANLGAFDTLLKPLDAARLHDALRSAVTPRLPHVPFVDDLRRTILGDSAALLKTLNEVARAIPHDDASVLLLGESGTGKELLAQALHRLGPRRDRPWMPVNVAAIPATLAESHLFGHEKGAFTGAHGNRRGYLEEAEDGTLFLDEIGDLPLDLQGKLLRAIQEREFRRLGGSQNIPLRARIISATHHGLAQAAKDGAFRLDLYNRLAQITIQVPPLRERAGDVELLADHFLARLGRPLRLARETRAVLASYPFPGNIRELDNILRAAAIQCPGEWILPLHLRLKEMGVFAARKESPAATDEPAWPARWLELRHHEAVRELGQAFDRAYLPRKLKEAGYSVSRAAQLAGIDRKTFSKRWQECGLPPIGTEREDDHE